MPQSAQLLTSRLIVEVDGSEISGALRERILEVSVEQHAHLPDMLALRLFDPGLEILDGGDLDLAKTIKVEAGYGGDRDVTLFDGEITALEPEFHEGMQAELVVRAFDRSHRLYRETRTEAYLNVKDSDLANQIANRAGLSAEVEPTRTVFEHIIQVNQSDLTFLMGRAWRIGFECYVEDGKLFFRKPPPQGDTVRLQWGDALLSFHPRMTLAEQVDEVNVHGWDIEKKEPIIGVAREGNLYPRIGESKDGGEWASAFGNGSVTLVDQNVSTQEEANELAQARLNELSGAFVVAEGEAFRKPEIRAGRFVELERLGERFSGTYLVTQATHIYASSGFKTRFSVRGARLGTVDEFFASAAPQRWPGTVTAVVSNIDDPKRLGRVKLKFPWLSQDAESDWARVVGIGAGKETGFFHIPSVGDEVLVAFENGHFGRPFVVGGLWNGKDGLPPDTAATGEEIDQVRIWQSRAGHRIAVYDNSDDKVEIKSKDGHEITLDDANRVIIIKTNGNQEITIDDNNRKIVFKGSGDVQVESGTSLTLESGTDLTIKAGTNLKLDASANIDINAGAMATLKGTMVNIN